MNPPDLTTLQILVPVAVGIFTILGILFGWFGKAWEWVAARRSKKTGEGFQVPTSPTLILNSTGLGNTNWWGFGSVAGARAMQVCCLVKATNISDCAIYPLDGTLQIPRTFKKWRRARIAHEKVVDVLSENGCIPKHTLVDISLMFWIIPPTHNKDETLVGNICLNDQFGNRNVVKNVAFRGM